MPIRVTHGKVSTAARFGIEAGKGQQRVRQAAEESANVRQQASIDAQAAANALRVSTDIQKAVLDAQSRREAMEFQSFMQGESAKRAIAWEQEKTELRNMHDFEMLEQRRDVENQLKTADDMREKTKLNSKMSALDAAVERGDITEEQAQQEKLRLEIGVPGSQSPLFKKKDEASIFADLLSRREDTSSAAPEQRNSAALLAIGNSKTTSTQNRADIKKILSEGDPVKIKHTLDIMEAKQKLEDVNPLSSFSPLGFGIQAAKLRSIKKTILPSSVRKPSRLPSPISDFGKLHQIQSMGSFR